jgi:hypothetical protein
MRKLQNQVLLFSGAMILTLVAALFFLPKVRCCEQDSAELEALTRAAADGQVAAIRALFERARKDGVPALEEHWALEGALRGDEQLRNAYIALFRTRFTDDRRKQVIARLSNEKNVTGAACLIAVLSNQHAPAGSCS